MSNGLVLSRKTGQRIVIDGGIRIDVLAIGKHRVKLAVIAPEEVRVMRAESTILSTMHDPAADAFELPRMGSGGQVPELAIAE